MPEKGGGHVLYSHLRASDLLAFVSSVLHSRSYTGTDHGKVQVAQSEKRIEQSDPLLSYILLALISVLLLIPVIAVICR